MKKVFYADFETTQPDENKRVFVYLWCMVRGKFKTYGENIESFIEYISKMKKSVIYFHNLKFDFSYIQYYLIKNKIKHKVLEKKGTIYQVKIFDIELRDSMNFLPMTLKEVGENYCSKYKKTSIDYNVQSGHKATEIEITYCYNDCYVLEEGLNNYLNAMTQILVENGCFKSATKVHKKLTNAGIAFEAFKELSCFEEACPKTTQNEYNLFRQAYRGGFVYSNPKGIVENVQMIDCNSMYPFIYSSIDMPYGRGITCCDFEDLKRFKFSIFKVLIKYDLKPGYIAIIGGGFGKYGGIDYKSTSDGLYEELVVSSTDFKLIQEFYDIDYKFVWGVGFQTKPEFFKKFAETFIKVKNKEKGIRRSVAKVLLNAPYGKTAMNGLQEIKNYYIDEKLHCVRSEVIGYEIDDDTFQYLPMAIAITAGARHYLLTTALKIKFDSIYYMDTDSIKFRAKNTGIQYDPNILGAWKDEGLVRLFKTISPKKYVYWGSTTPKETSLVIHYTCAGFSQKTLTSEMKNGEAVSLKEAYNLINKFDKGLSLSCLQSQIVEGGRALLPVLKEIK